LLLRVEGGAEGANGRFQNVEILMLQFTVMTSLVTCFQLVQYRKKECIENIERLSNL